MPRILILIYMDKLKLKLQEYYQHCQQQETRTKTGRKAAGKAAAPEMENDILLQFGLPTSKRFVQILHDFVSHSQVNDHLLDYVSKEQKVTFETLFMQCENRIHAIFTFLSMLELIQMKYMSILTGTGRNNFIVEWNTERPDDVEIILNHDQQNRD